MTLQAIPAFIAKQADGITDFQHPVETMRNFHEALFGRSGVFRFGDFAVTPTGTGMGINIASGNAILNGSSNSTQGAYFLWSTTNAVDTLTTLPASGSTRYDTVILRVVDGQYGTITGAPRAALEVVAGLSGAGAPRADSYFNSGGTAYQPGAWLRLADIRIDPTDTTISNGKITTNHQYVNIPGALILCHSSNRPSNPRTGERIFEVDTEFTYLWSNSQWNLQPKFIKDASEQNPTFLNGPEVNLPNMQLSTTTLRKDTRYLIQVQGNFNVGFADDQWELRIRKNTALSGVLVRTFLVPAVSTNPAGYPFNVTIAYDTTGATEFTSFHFSVARVGGPGGAANWNYGYARLDAIKSI